MLLTILGIIALIVLAAMLGSVAVTYAATCTVVETLPTNTGSAADALRKVTHAQYDETATLNAGSTPPATLVAEFLQALTVGAATVDLRALVGTNGAVIDGNGLKVQVLRVKNLGANVLTLAEGGSNGYAIFGASGQVDIPPGGHIQMFFNDSSPDIGAGDKEIDLTGTGSQTSEWTIVMG